MSRAPQHRAKGPPEGPTIKLNLSKHGYKSIQDKNKNNAVKLDVRNQHQNAYAHGIQSLRQFQCPVCKCLNTIRIELESKAQRAIVRCSYCCNLKPPPENLPYPYVARYVPKVNIKADCFFEFANAYERLAKAQVGDSLSNCGSGGNEQAELHHKDKDNTSDKDNEGDGLFSLDEVFDAKSDASAEYDKEEGNEKDHAVSGKRERTEHSEEEDDESRTSPKENKNNDSTEQEWKKLKQDDGEDVNKNTHSEENKEEQEDSEEEDMIDINDFFNED